MVVRAKFIPAGLGLQAFDDPFAVDVRVDDSVVHAVRAAFPEFDSRRHNSLSAPVRRPRNISVAGKSLFGVFELLFERVARGDGL